MLSAPVRKGKVNSNRYFASVGNILSSPFTSIFTRDCRLICRWSFERFRLAPDPGQQFQVASESSCLFVFVRTTSHIRKTDWCLCRWWWWCALLLMALSLLRVGERDAVNYWRTRVISSVLLHSVVKSTLLIDVSNSSVSSTFRYLFMRLFVLFRRHFLNPHVSSCASQHDSWHHWCVSVDLENETRVPRELAGSRKQTRANDPINRGDRCRRIIRHSPWASWYLQSISPEDRQTLTINADKSRQDEKNSMEPGTHLWTKVPKEVQVAAVLVSHILQPGKSRWKRVREKERKEARREWE